MARRRAVAPRRPEGVPVELTSMDHPAWRDPALCAGLFQAWGLDPGHGTTSVERLSWPDRFTRFRQAWCEVNGMMSARWPGRIDLPRAREAGVDVRGTSRARSSAWMG